MHVHYDFVVYTPTSEHLSKTKSETDLDNFIKLQHHISVCIPYFTIIISLIHAPGPFPVFFNVAC